MAQTLSNYAAMLKEFYTSDRVAQMILQRSPLLAMLPKKEIMGESFDVPILYGDTAGHSATFSTAQTNKGQSSSAKFQVTTATAYALASVDRRLMLASRNNAGAFLPGAKVNIDGAFRQVRRDLAVHAYRDGSGARGRVSSYNDAGATGTITLTVAADAVNFSIGDVLKFCATKTGGSIESGDFTVTAIDTEAGTITGSEDSVTINTNDYIYVEGDYDAVLDGLASWIPTSAPGATSFFGMDRSVHPTMLGGVRSNATGKLRYEALIDAQSACATIGDGAPTHGFVHPNDFRALIKEMESQVTRPRAVSRELPVGKNSKAVVGFSGIVVQGDAGEIEVFPDRFAEPGTAYMLELSSCGLAHIGPQLADIVGRDSDEGMLVEGSSDGYEIRVASYSQLYTNAPGHNVVVYNLGS